MLLLCCFVFFLSTTSCQEAVNKTENENEYTHHYNYTNYVNDTNKPVGPQNVSTHVISKPSQTQQIERTAIPSANFSGSEKKTFGDFRPSPQLDIGYEFNKYPVPPAFPEAKHLGNEVKVPTAYEYFNERYQTTTEYPWTSKVKFPADSHKDRPYKFYTEDEEPPSFSVKNSYGFPAKHEEFSFNKPVPITPKVKPGVFAKYPPQHKNYGYNLMERPSPPHKGHGYEMSHYDNAWKKIIKILTAFIPIGLIISALTPTVITITNATDTSTTTQSRYRLNDKNVDFREKLVQTLSHFEGLQGRGCEERMLCELLLAASMSPNAKTNVKNFLDTFSERFPDITEKTEELKKIFAAVRYQDCSSIKCENIKKPT